MDLQVDIERQPLLENAPQKIPKTSTQKTMRKALKGTTYLANLLPTGTVLIFQTLSPALTHRDSFRDERGKVRYGFATLNGIWVMDGSVKLHVEEARKYKLRLIDLFHACGSILVFGAIALFNQSVITCLAPKPSEEAKEILGALPIGIGILCSFLFVLFPTQRHGIGFPLSRD
ncbi:hypothetical protein KIW84_073744 [Lathyrus oleraceus]|uniref:Uncharacterized protein n=1 Tax=Pisum sativum TaxID=3888 RepID=A0A9D4ZZ16_PEA|nr:hypothetical protein KIW84_073744 [Pisum sativum]